ncbi:MAG: 3-ketoacyl-ACP reductase [Terriglobia bacterium]|nr:MAG: 3-ketoacyl-ACP reductase [Terriglobia bacterium]
MIFFVTGGSRGIGRSIVLEAVRAGHSVGFTFHKQEQCASAVVQEAKHIRPEARCQAFPLDVRDAAAVEKTGSRFAEEFGGVDVVVPNAGINSRNLLFSMSDEEWDDVIRTNLTGAFYVCRQFLPAMLANRFGRFILVSSLAHNGMSGEGHYSAAKAGLHGLSGTLAKEYGRKGITSNVIVPGFFDTDLTRGSLSQVNQEFWIQYCPLGRIGDLPDVARTVLFLASEAASFINGQIIPITGGLDWAP